jgi:hypothetical protein
MAFKLKIPMWMVLLLVTGVGAILLAYSGFRNEGFQAGYPSAFCGAGAPACPSGKRCMNQQCAGTDVPALPANELPVYPQGNINGRILS